MNNISLLNLQNRAARDYVHEQGHSAGAGALLMSDDSAAGTRFTNFLASASLPLPPASISGSSWDLRHPWVAADHSGAVSADHYANNVSPPTNASAIRQLFRIDDTISGDGRRPLGFLDLHQQEAASAPRDRPAAATTELTSVANDGMLIDLAAGLRRQSNSDSASHAAIFFNAAPDSRRMLLNNLRPSCTASETELLQRPLLHDLHANLSQIRGVTSGRPDKRSLSENGHRSVQLSRQSVQKRDNILQIRSGGFEGCGGAAGYGVSTPLEPPLAAYSYSGADGTDYLKYGAGVGARIGLDLGGRTYFSAEDNKLQYYNNHFHSGTSSCGSLIFPAASTTRSSMMMICSNAMNYMQHVPLCQAEGCRADLSVAKHYHRRHKVCEYHSKASVVTINGNRQRFCQQCSRFHALSEFDEGKRSCRKRLADHNRRRRKPATGTGSATIGRAAAEPVAAASGAASTDSNNNNNGNSCDASSPSSAAGKRNAAVENTMEERQRDVEWTENNVRMDVELRATGSVGGGGGLPSISTLTTRSSGIPPPAAGAASTSVGAPSIMLTLQNDNKPPSHDHSSSSGSAAPVAADSSYLLNATSLSLSNGAPVVVNESFTSDDSGHGHGAPSTFAALSSSAPPSALHSFADDDGAELSRAAALPWLIRPSNPVTHGRLSAASAQLNHGNVDSTRDCLSMGSSTHPAESSASMILMVPEDVRSSTKQARADGQIFVCKSVERILSERQSEEQNSTVLSTSSLKDRNYAVNHNLNAGGSNGDYLYNGSNARTIDSNANGWAHLNLQRDQDYNLLPAAVCRSAVAAAPRQ